MRDRLTPIVAVASAAVVPLPALHFVGPEHVSVPGVVHFVGVGATAAVATVAAILL